MATPSFIAPTSPLDRRRLGKYEVLCRLSTGGMSEIYLAHQTGLAGFNKLVVLKTILPDIGGEEDFVRMFLDEARTTAAFNHPNIAQVYELDTDDGQLFMAMEFVQGCTLVEMARACRAAREAIPIGFTLAAVRDTALALHYAHTFTDARGRKQIVIHRDVAEKNIMVTYEGVTKLLDFGIAKALGRSGRTGVGMVKGTSGYMSPEQIRGEPLDGRSDIFALGVVAHECLTGLRLFHGKSPEEGMMAALKENVVPPSRWNPQVPPAVDAVVLKALQRDREARFATALEFAREIDRVGHGLIWHPEQSGELVLKYFNDRRAETRRLLESSVNQEVTGEIRVKSIIQKVRATASTPGTDAPKPEQATPAPTPVISAALRRPTQNMPPATQGTAPNINPVTLRQPDPTTSPARPKVLRADPPPAPAPRAIDLTPRASEFDDDEADAKTIPAAALPDEVRELRKRMLEAAQAKKASPTGTTTPVAASVRTSRPDTSSITEPTPVQPPAPVVASAARANLATEPERRPVLPVTDASPALKVPPRDTDGDTLSITNRGSPPTDWDDDDVGARTTIARPDEVLGQIKKQQSDDDLRATQEREPSSVYLREVRWRSRALMVVLVAMALLAVVGILVLLEVIPLGAADEPQAEAIPAVVQPTADTAAEAPPEPLPDVPAPTPAPNKR
ncbi:MAG: protein kinase [Myxococcota bacterium]